MVVVSVLLTTRAESRVSWSVGEFLLADGWVVKFVSTSESAAAAAAAL